MPGRSRTVWLQLVSLLATGWILWNRSLVPQFSHYSPGSIVWRAVWFSLLAGMWSGFITLGLMMTIRRVERVDVVGITLRTTAAGIWFAPATILLAVGSPLAVGAALILVASATRLLYFQWRLVHPETGMETVLVPRSAGIFGLGAAPDAFQRRGLLGSLGPALAIAIGLQLGIVAWMMEVPPLAAAFFCMTTALLTVFSISAGAWEEQRQPSLPRSVVGILLTVLLAAVLGIGGYVTGSSGAGEADANPFSKPSKPGELTKVAEVPHPPPKLVQPPAPVRAADQEADPPGIGAPAAGSFPGVIIWPEIKPVPFLIEPVPKTSVLAKRGPARLLTIPFGGEYWLFRMPFSRPPRNSIRRRGKPTALSFSSIDHWPLSMEAHQELHQILDLSCCSHIEVSVANADLYPGTITLELQVIDSKAYGLPPESLGRLPLQSAPDTGSRPVIPVAETLSFVAPAAPLHGQFDELCVIFHRERVRADKSARVAIDHFALVPRGQ